MKNKIIEIRSYNLKPGIRTLFDKLINEKSLPMLRHWNVDVVAYGASLHDDDSYFLMRAYENPEERQKSQDAFYGSDEWINGPREEIISLIINYTTVVIEADEELINRLRVTM